MKTAITQLTLITTAIFLPTPLDTLTYATALTLMAITDWRDSLNNPGRRNYHYATIASTLMAAGLILHATKYLPWGITSLWLSTAGLFAFALGALAYIAAAVFLVVCAVVHWRVIRSAVRRRGFRGAVLRFLDQYVERS